MRPNGGRDCACACHLRQVLHEREGQPDELLAVLEAGSLFGELGLLYNSPRSSTVRAREISEVWVLRRSAFQHALISASGERRSGLLHTLGAHAAIARIELAPRAARPLTQPTHFPPGLTPAAPHLPGAHMPLLTAAPPKLQQQLALCFHPVTLAAGASLAPTDEDITCPLKGWGRVPGLGVCELRSLAYTPRGTCEAHTTR